MMNGNNAPTIPYDPDAEATLCGIVLREHAKLLEVSAVVEADDFIDERHKLIFQAVTDAWEDDPACDLATVASLLRKRNQLDRAGGYKYLIECIEAVVSPAAAEHHAKTIANYAKLRHVIEAAERIVHNGYRRPGDIASFIREAEGEMFEATREADHRPATSIFDAGQRFYDRISNGQLATGVPTGFHTIDAKLKGLKAGNLCIIAARPSMGKSALALNIAENVATAGKAVAFFSCEMTTDELTMRMLSKRTRIPSDRIAGARLQESDWLALSDAIGQTQAMPLYLIDRGGLSMSELRSRCRRMVSKHDLRLIVIDYLQLLVGEGEGRYDRFSKISGELKALATQLELPIICLSQLNRQCETRPDKRPQMGDLRETGAIEQDADIVMLLHRPKYYDPAADNQCEVIIAKHRNGSTGTGELTFQPEFASFGEDKNLSLVGGSQ